MTYSSCLLLCFFAYSQIFSMIQHDRWNTTTYVNDAKIQRAFGQKISKELGGYFNQSVNLLDVGCGDGFLSQYIAASVGAVVGIDSSENMITHASSKYKIDNLRFDHQSIENLSSLQEYDCVTAFNVLQYVQSIKTVLNRIYNALKTDGTFIATVRRSTPSDKLSLALLEAFAACDIKRDERLYVPQINRADDWDLELKQIGFINIKTEPCDYQYVFNTREEFEKWVYACPHSINQLVMVLQDKEMMYCQKVVEKYLEKIDYKGGPITFTYPAFLIIGQR